VKNSCGDVVDLPVRRDAGLDCFEPETKTDSQPRWRSPSLHEEAPRRHPLRAVRGRRQALRFWQRSAAFGWSVLICTFACGLLIGAMLARPVIPPATPAAASVELVRRPPTPAATSPVGVLDERATAGSDVTLAVDAGAGRGAPDLHAQRPRPAVPTPRGTLIVTSIPRGAAVFLNDEYAGETPLTMRGLMSGSRAVRVAVDGYAVWSRGVQIVAGEATMVSAKLNELNRAE